MKTLADMVAIAREARGFTASPGKVPEDIYMRALYERVIAFDEEQPRADEMARMSSCALAVRGFLHHLGVKHPRLDTLYRGGQAVTDVAEIAREAGALLPFGAEILPGHVLIVTPPEHVLTVVEVTPTIGPRSLITSIDGGIRDPEAPSYYSIQQVTRRLGSLTVSSFPGMSNMSNGTHALEYWQDGIFQNRRAITHHIDTARIFERFGS